MLKVLDSSGIITNQEDMIEGIKGYESLNPNLEHNEVHSINEAREKRVAELLWVRPDLHALRAAYIRKEDYE